MNLKDLILNANVPLNKVAIVDGNKSYTYKDLFYSLRCFTNYLYNMGLRNGQKVVFISDHNSDALIALLSCILFGIDVIMPYNLLNPEAQEIKNLINASNPDYVLYTKSDMNIYNNISEFNKKLINIDGYNDVLYEDGKFTQIMKLSTSMRLVFFSSGTTSMPKAIVIPETLIYLRTQKVTQVLEFTSSSNIFISGLINNTTGIIFTLGALFNFATMYFPQNRQVCTWPEYVSSHRITHIMLRPASLAIFVENLNMYDYSNLKVIAYGAASLAASILESARRFLPCKWIQGYGLSETFGPFCWLNDTHHSMEIHKKYIYCIGKPDQSVEMKLSNMISDDIGEIHIKGSLMEGYISYCSGHINSPSEWFATGDLGQITADGFFVLKGRKSNCILNEDGHQIFPEEVEAIVKQIAGINEAVVLSSDDAFGSKPLLCISGGIAKENKSIIKNKIFDLLSGSLSKEKWPLLVYCDALPFPKNQNDKIIYSVLRDKAINNLTFTL